MARKQTREELERAYQETHTEADLYRKAYQDTKNGVKPLAVHSWKDRDDVCKHTARLFGVERMDGGYVVVTFHCPTQADSDYLVYLDTWTPYDLDGKIAKERLGIARTKAYQAEMDARKVA